MFGKPAKAPQFKSRQSFTHSFISFCEIMLRGVKCNVCGEIGQHFSSACPHRITGVPLGMRDETGKDALDIVAEQPRATVSDYLAPERLDALIRKRPELPPFLRCRACSLLPRDAVWCQCCDIFVCATCLGPPDEGCWMCPVCEYAHIDNFHVIAAMRAVVTAWFQSAAEVVDPYCVSSDEDERCIDSDANEDHETTSTHKQKRRRCRGGRNAKRPSHSHHHGVG